LGGSGGEGGTAGTGGSCSPVDHDEDNDGVDDACDNCPTYDNDDQENDDDDGVGNACEEWSEEGLLSRIEYFESWMPQSAPAPWAFEPKFDVSEDVAHVNDESCGSACGENAFLQKELGTAYSVETTFRLEPGTTGWIGVLFGHKAQTGSTWECVIYRTQYYRNVELWYREQFGEGFTRVAYEEQIEEWNEPADTQRRLRVYSNGSTFWCEFENASGAYAIVQSPLSSIPDMSGQSGIRVYDAHAHFDSFVAYE